MYIYIYIYICMCVYTYMYIYIYIYIYKGGASSHEPPHNTKRARETPRRGVLFRVVVCLLSL